LAPQLASSKHTSNKFNAIDATAISGQAPACERSMSDVRRRSSGLASPRY
jgi:hypothetical protein